MRIIVIEDNELYKNELLQCLEQEESDIEIVGSASNGAEGLALTEKLIRDNLTPDVIFTDIKMPVMDGIEALKEIRRYTAELPVIMQTAYAFDTDRRTAEEAGCNGFITKPVMPRELKMYLDKYLNK